MARVGTQEITLGFQQLHLASAKIASVTIVGDGLAHVRFVPDIDAGVVVAFLPPGTE